MGTDIIMHIKPDTDDEKYSEFLESWRIQELVRKYSDYIRFPIRMEVSKTRKKEGCPDDKPEYETYQEEETLNSMVPIWQRRKSSVKPEEYNKFYRDKFHDYTDPQRVIAVSAEGAVTYKALLFIHCTSSAHQRQTSRTAVFGTPALTPNMLMWSPLYVHQPSAISLMSPVPSTMPPCWFALSMRICVRSRACVFSNVTSWTPARLCHSIPGHRQLPLAMLCG